MIPDQRTHLNHIERPDESLLADIWTALWKEDTIRLLDIDSISVTVKEGYVQFVGHVAREQNKQLIEFLARSIPGISSIDNKIITDRSLAVEVAHALAGDERTNPFNLRSGSDHGWIRVNGDVPSREIQSAVEEVAGRVPNGRGVVALPVLPGKRYPPQQQPVQPQVGASVYGENGQVGVVTQVVIDPRNRLVQEMAFDIKTEVDGWPISGEYMLPVEALEVVNQDSIILARHRLPSNGYPPFDPADYPLAPAGWQPPYPYSPGTVRWPRPAIKKEEQHTPEELSIKSSRSGTRQQHSLAFVSV